MGEIPGYYRLHLHRFGLHGSYPSPKGKAATLSANARYSPGFAPCVHFVFELLLM